MDRDELFASIAAARPDRDDLVYLERQGDRYQWRVVADGAGIVDLDASDGPDVWLSFSAAWPLDDPVQLHAFFDDLLAELESMADTADRCRWPIDEPWPHFH
jgi:hypothetical protein